ncbi:MAG: PadR family transcriptional regulator [Lachnospiraceae bacterium]|nr:PadR family transcriptional regulator [Lachnospiraceae bacterium]
MDESQLLKGILEGCILSIIAKGETYGYEILSQLEEDGFEGLGEGTLYPVLTRLDKKGYILCRKAKSPLGPIRKYYSITENGKENLEKFKEVYKKMTQKADKILFCNDLNEEKGGDGIC